ncbi:hypothetical protein CLAIMM_09812 [Cladophialophora immunda]|nr:hypothetical protein CLAIMM_09812 [Cladophialophora immunda]
MAIEVTMVCNAGGRAFDAIRTLSVLQTIGNPGTIIVMHHTDIKRALLELNPEANELIESSKFGEITTGMDESIRADIAFLKASPLVKNTTQIVGLAYDIESGVLREVDVKENRLRMSFWYLMPISNEDRTLSTKHGDNHM